MSIRNLPMRALLVTALGAILSLTQLTAFAKTPEPSGLFVESENGAQKTQSRHARRGQYREVKLDYKKLRKGRIFVKLPDGTSYEAVRELQQEKGKGRFAWVGHASDDRDNRVVLGVSGDAVAGTFSYQGKMFRLEPRANGSHVIREVSPSDPAPELDPIPVADTAAGNSSTQATTSAADSNGAVIDVLVAYTPAVQALYGPAGTEALILQAVAEANQAYANSAMSTRLNLVKSVLTNYTESGNMNTDLGRLRGTSDGYMDEIHTLRNQYGADLVSLIENEPAYCGLSYRMASLSSSFASSAFSVVHYDCATGYYSFAHEIGHNQGAHHDFGNATGGAAIYPYAYGFQEPSNAFRTIMSYSCPGGCTRIAYFSNSQVYYNGRPTGNPGSTENANTIDATAATVAGFRGAAPQLPPTAPSGLAGTPVGANQIDVTWKDMSTNESGFLLERSTDGLNFRQIASLVANTSSYHDDNLAPDTLYHYRARAWNSNGNSAYSNLTVVATEDEPVHFDQFADSDVSVSGTVTGSVEDTWSRDGSKVSITESDTPADASGKRSSLLAHYWIFTVAAGDTITLYADVDTTVTSQSFTFAYSTTGGLFSDNSKWIDMFTVSAATPGEMQFELPASLSGKVYISVRDGTRVLGVTTKDAINIDYLAIRTRGGSGVVAAPPPAEGPPPGC